MASLRAAPSTVPALAALVLFVVWATDQGGYPVTHWSPGGLIILSLLALTLVIVGLRRGEVPVPVRIALGCLAAYTALSFLSILWAGVKADAWEGANRTLLYLLVFTLFACWRQRGPSAALLLAVWTLAMTGVAAFVALHLAGASSAALQSLLPGGRLIYPTGYANADAALWLMALWPALLLARSSHLPWGLRGLLAGGAVLLAELGLFSQSRGSLYATPVMLVLVFALLPQRTRTFAVLVPVAAGIGAAAPAVLRVGDNLQNGEVAGSTMHTAVVSAFAAAVAVGLVVAVAAAVESRTRLSERARRQLHRGVGAIAILTLVAVLGVGLAAAGDPVARVKHGWETFKSGYASDSSAGSRLTSGLGSNRYDFYRVALDEFASHPLIGIGVDNFQQQYLAHGRSEETPRYPHSVEMRTLVQTGLVGAVLAVVGLGAALLAAFRAIRPRTPGRVDPLAGEVAAAALAGFAYWVVHGSFDWFWEFAGLGAAAFALLGIACALVPGSARTGGAPPAAATEDEIASSSSREQPRAGRRPAGRRDLRPFAGIAVALLLAATFVLPWLSQLQVQSAARIWGQMPLRAYARLDDAAGLNPLSDEPYLVAGSIALRFGDLARAKHEFALALGRNPGDAYATLELGAIASSEGDRREALSLLERAARLNPRDSLTLEALALARAGRRVDVAALNRSILLKGLQLG